MRKFRLALLAVFIFCPHFKCYALGEDHFGCGRALGYVEVPVVLEHNGQEYTQLDDIPTFKTEYTEDFKAFLRDFEVILRAFSQMKLPAKIRFRILDTPYHTTTPNFYRSFITDFPKNELTEDELLIEIPELWVVDKGWRNNQPSDESLSVAGFRTAENTRVDKHVLLFTLSNLVESLVFYQFLYSNPNLRKRFVEARDAFIRMELQYGTDVVRQADSLTGLIGKMEPRNGDELTTDQHLGAFYIMTGFMPFEASLRPLISVISDVILTFLLRNNLYLLEEKFLNKKATAEVGERGDEGSPQRQKWLESRRRHYQYKQAHPEEFNQFLNNWSLLKQAGFVHAQRKKDDLVNLIPTDEWDTRTKAFQDFFDFPSNQTTPRDPHIAGIELFSEYPYNADLKFTKLRVELGALFFYPLDLDPTSRRLLRDSIPPEFLIQRLTSVIAQFYTDENRLKSENQDSNILELMSEVREEFQEEISTAEAINRFYKILAAQKDQKAVKAQISKHAIFLLERGLYDSFFPESEE